MNKNQAHRFYVLINKKYEKAEKGECHCEELNELNAQSFFQGPKELCILCMAKSDEGKSYDPDEAVDKVNDLKKYGYRS